MGLSSFLALSVKVDWDADGSFAEAESDVSAYARYPLRTSRGRAKVTDEFGAGSGIFSLLNEEGRFTPLYASSPLYPNVLPGREVVVEVVYDGTTYPVFRGRCTPERQVSSLPASIEFSMLDAFEELRTGLTNTALQQSARVDEVITAVLDDIVWDAGRRDLGTGPDTLTVFTNHNRLPINALQLAAAQDPGGALFIARAGDVTYQNRHFRSTQAVYATLAGTFNDLDPQLRQEDVVEAVRATYPRFEVSSALATVWTLQLPRRLRPGVTEFEVELNASGVLGATGYVTPVATTDYIAETAQDGSGTDKTAQVTAAIRSSDSGGAVLQFTNADSSDVWLQAGGATKLRAYPLQEGGEVNAIRKTVSSPLVANQTLTREFEFLDDEDVVEGWVSWQRNVRGDFRVRPVVEIVPDTDALMAVVLGAEIGKRVTLTDTGAAWLTQVDGDYFIEGIEMEFGGPGEVRAVWRLFDADLAIGSMFRISGPGADYSVIGGDDRIGY